LVLELTGRKEPQNGLQGKFSVYHGFAAGLIFGRAGEAEYADAVVRRDDVVALRRKVEAAVDPAIREDAAQVTVTLRGGRQVPVRVEHAIGSFEHPLSDAQLEAKFHALADPVIGSARAQASIESCRDLAQAKDLRVFLRHAAGSAAPTPGEKP
jgi:2-methylcitrate dehydratase PrpD